MRTGVWAAAVVCAVGVVSSAQAQGLSTTPLGGVPPSAIVNKPIDMSRVIAPMPALPAQQNRFNFSAIFNKRILPAFPSKRGVSPLPSPSTFPKYQDFKIVGAPPRFIGDPKMTSSPFKPVMPIIPSTKTPVGPGSQ
jgi:hypothetical protein